jgi:hypothetical protein
MLGADAVLTYGPRDLGRAGMGLAKTAAERAKRDWAVNTTRTNERLDE